MAALVTEPEALMPIIAVTARDAILRMFSGEDKYRRRYGGFFAA